MFAISEAFADSNNDIFAVSVFQWFVDGWFSHLVTNKQQQKEEESVNGLHLQITQNLAAKLSCLYVRKTKKRQEKTGPFLENPLKKHCYLPEEDVDAVDVA